MQAVRTSGAKSEHAALTRPRTVSEQTPRSGRWSAAQTRSAGRGEVLRIPTSSLTVGPDWFTGAGGRVSAGDETNAAGGGGIISIGKRAGSADVATAAGGASGPRRSGSTGGGFQESTRTL